MKFDPDIAKRFGLEESIMIHNLSFWISLNKKNGKHFHNNKYWTYGSCSYFSTNFIFWTPRKIQRILSSLIKQGVIIKGNYNRHRYDRTGWYAFRAENDFINDKTLTETNLPKNKIVRNRKKLSDNNGEWITQNEIQELLNVAPPVTQAVVTIPDKVRDGNKKDTAAAEAAIIYLKNAWDRKLLSREKEKLLEMLKTHGSEKLFYAIDESVFHHVLKMTYIESILSTTRWKGKNSSSQTDMPIVSRKQGVSKSIGGLITFECQNEMCDGAIVIQREKLFRAAKNNTEIPCPTCKTKYLAEYILNHI